MAKWVSLMYYGETVDLALVEMMLHIYDNITRPEDSESRDTQFTALREALLLTSTRNEHYLGAIRPERIVRTISAVLVRFRNTRCANPRDRLYGTLPFIDWQGKLPLRINYKLSNAELALSLLDYYDDKLNAIQFIHLLVEALNISVDDLQQCKWLSSNEDIQASL
ncbi:hypothetical protein F5Y06DRAFT_280314 [Hypoxylon sp. FL0890]|nr:hypothetical protein F5Y06DRAFT_280314 [Hypoxylon sp. FL0890]